MRRVTRFVLATTALVLLLGPGRARADFVSFGYHWSISPGAVIPGGTGSVTLALAADDAATVSTGVTTAIAAATVTTTSSATSPPDTFNVPFSLGLDLSAGGDSAHLTFSGTVAGTLTATTSTLTSTFDQPVTQVRTLGGYVYTVTIDPVLANLPSPVSEAAVLLDALVTVRPPPDDQQPGPTKSPEPSTLLLGVSGVSLLWLARRRRRAAVVAA